MNLSDIAIVGVGLTPQQKRSDRNSLQVALDAAKLALADAGLSHTDLVGIAARWPGPGGSVLAPGSADWSTLLGVPLDWIGDSYPQGVPALVDAAGAILTGQATTVLITGGQAGVLGGGRVAAYTQPGNEFVAPFGAFTSAHFALVAQRHLARHPHARQGMAEIAASIRNVGSVNPEAVMAGRGPYTADDILAAPPIVDPFTLLDLCLASEGGAAVIVTTLERARDLPHPPIVVLGAGMEWLRQQYVDPARYEQTWTIGASAARKAFAQAGIGPLLRARRGHRLRARHRHRPRRQAPDLHRRRAAGLQPHRVGRADAEARRGRPPAARRVRRQAGRRRRGRDRIRRRIGRPVLQPRAARPGAVTRQR